MWLVGLVIGVIIAEARPSPSGQVDIAAERSSDRYVPL